MIQEVLIGIIFLASLGYVASLIFKTLQSKRVCASGCGKCGAADLEKIERQIAAAQQKN